MSADYRATTLVEQIQPWCVPIPLEMQADFAPAVGCLYEWQMGAAAQRVHRVMGSLHTTGFAAFG